MRDILVAFSILSYISCAWASDSPTRTKISTRVTWVSAGSPEIHVLLQNPLSQEVEFALTPLALKKPGSSAVCLSEIGKAVRKNYLRVAPSTRETGGSNGMVPAKGWAHRVYLLASGVQSLGCVQPLLVSLFDKAGSKVAEDVEVRIEQPEGSRFKGDVRRVKLTAHSMVEQDESNSRANEYLIRTLVQSFDKVSVIAAVTDRKIVCSSEGGELVSIPVFTGDQVPQRLDSGPYTINPGAWAVFVSNVTLEPVAASSACKVQVELSVLTEDSGFQRAMTSVVPLTPTGFFMGRGIR